MTPLRKRDITHDNRQIVVLCIRLHGDRRIKTGWAIFDSEIQFSGECNLALRWAVRHIVQNTSNLYCVANSSMDELCIEGEFEVKVVMMESKRKK